MSNYQVLESILTGIYSVTTAALSEEQAEEQLRRDLSHQPFRSAISQELRDAFADPKVRWRDLLVDHDVLLDPTEDVARDYVIRHIWRVVLGNEEPPSAK
jgi:hypothetical protein